jgi:hypothetical protein
MTTWNPADKSADLTLSPDQLTVTKTAGGGAWDSLRSTGGRLSGLHYFEVTANVVGANGAVIGIGSSAASLANHPGAGTAGSGIGNGSGSYYYNTATTIALHALVGASMPMVAGDTIGIKVAGSEFAMAFSMVNELYTYEGSVINLWSQSVPFSSGLVGFNSWFAMMALFDVGAQYTINFGASDFVIGKIPHGYTSYDGNQSWEDWYITTDDAAALELPPKPPAPNVRLLNPDGTPTKAYHDFMTKQYEWERTLRTGLVE